MGTFDPEFQKSFTEAINKENRIRMKWQLNYKATMESRKALASDEQPAHVLEHLQERSQEGAIVWPDINGTGTIIRVVDPLPMQKVDRKHKAELYHGISYEDQGRLKYLNTRKRLSPDQRYTRMVCSNWEYGWKGKQHLEDISCDDPNQCNVISRCYPQP